MILLTLSLELVLQLGQVLDLREGHELNRLDLAVLKQIEIAGNLGDKKSQRVGRVGLREFRALF